MDRSFEIDCNFRACFSPVLARLKIDPSLNSRVIDEYIQFREFAVYPLSQFDPLIFASDVAGLCMQFRNLFFRSLKLFFVAPTNDHVIATLRKALSESKSDPVRAACY